MNNKVDEMLKCDKSDYHLVSDLGTAFINPSMGGGWQLYLMKTVLFRVWGEGFSRDLFDKMVAQTLTRTLDYSLLFIQHLADWSSALVMIRYWDTQVADKYVVPSERMVCFYITNTNLGMPLAYKVPAELGDLTNKELTTVEQRVEKAREMALLCIMGGEPLPKEVSNEQH